ncbi:MAG: hypothetical protein ACREU3_01555 [Steroidobacteraceae bacterium]
MTSEKSPRPRPHDILAALTITPAYGITHTQPLSPSVSLVYLRKSNARP